MALGVEVLDDPSYAVPPVAAGTRGVAWLRSNVVRFSEGPVHQRRRALTERLLDELGRASSSLACCAPPGTHAGCVVVGQQATGLPPSSALPSHAPDDAQRRPWMRRHALMVNPAWHDSPTVVLAVSLGLPPTVVDDVGLVASSYQPHLPVTREADEAVERLVEQCGTRDERAAALICLLVQAHDATRALIEVRSGARPAPPVPVTRRISPDGELVEIDLADAPFGRGRHACPAERLANRLADAAVRAGER